MQEKFTFTKHSRTGGTVLANGTEVCFLEDP